MMRPHAGGRNIVYWLPRGLALLYLGLLVLLSADVFEEGLGAGEILVALLMHLIPAFVFLAAALLAWRHPMAGGWLLLALGCAVTFIFGTYRHFWGFMAVSLPVLLLGVMFLLEGYRPALAHRG